MPKNLHNPFNLPLDAEGYCTDPKTGRRICGVRKKQSPGPCTRAPMVNGRCYMHGGPTPKGIASPHYRTGKWSAYMPTKMLQRFEGLFNSPELLELGQSVALVDTRLTELLEELGTGAAAQGELRDAWAELIAARAADDKKRMSAALNRIGDLIEQGDGRQTWADILQVLEQRRRLVDSEQKRRMAHHQTMTYDEGMLLVSRAGHAFKDALLEHIQDTAIIRAILNGAAARLAPVMGAPVSERLAGASAGGDPTDDPEAEE